MDLRLWAGPNNGATYDDLRESAQVTEELGFAGYFISDHLTPFVGDGVPGPTDVWTTLAGLSRETSTIRLGSLVTSVTFRLPGPLAIIVAQLDQMSAGRIDFGIGAGYFEHEHRAYGIPFPPARERSDRLSESLELITGMWRTPPGQTFSHRGEHYELIDSPALPKPVQEPHPPIIIGGTGKKRTPAIAARFADEFNLQTTRRRTPQNAEGWFSRQDLVDQIDRIRTAARDTQRDPNRIVFSMSAAIGIGKNAEEATAAMDPAHYDGQSFDGAVLTGSPSDIVDELSTYAALGISRVYVRAPCRLGALRNGFEVLASEVLPHLDRLP